MSSVIPLSRLEPAGIRTAWPDEARNFTPWLAENLDLLGQALGLDLELEATEVAVGPFSADILARSLSDNRRVLIENQCTQTDHRHLGQILTYAAGLETSIVVWVVETFRDEHRAAVDFLNRVTNEEMAFFGIEVRLFRVGHNHVPQLDVVARPNSWARDASEGRRAVETGSTARAWEAYWTEILDGVSANFPEARGRKPSRASWQSFLQLPIKPSLSIWLWVILNSKGNLKCYFEFSGPKAKQGFDLARERMIEVPDVLGLPLTWDRKDHQKGSNVSVTMPGLQIHLDETQRPGQIEWISMILPAFVETMQPAFQALDHLDEDAPETDAQD